MNYETLRMIVVIVIITRVEYSTCQRCSEGEYWFHKKCEKCSVGCKSCTLSNSCTSCNEGYYHASNYCFNCTLNNCKTCSAQYSCDACNEGYYLRNDDQCYICSDTCKECTQGHYYDGTACLPCRTPCTSCNSETKCTACDTGYYLFGTNCYPCTKSCVTCEESATKCTACGTGYYLFGTNCYPCTKSCVTCEESATKCTACGTGYYLFGTNCYPCTKSCVTCQSSATNCTSCNRGYYLHGNTCYNCTNQCIACKSASQCTACDTGYYISGGQCQRCPLGCSSCSANDKCTSCSPGYDMNNGQCIKCPERCGYCLGTDTCITCRSGYSLMSGQCYKCPTECATCSSDNKCSSCSQIGYYVEKSSCVKCPQDCESCTSKENCVFCIKGFYGNNQCLQECSDKCKDKDCDIKGRCLECVDGLYGDSCEEQCPEFCAQCHRNTSVCLLCNKGSYLYNNQCKQCTEMCAVCTRTRCTECVVGRWGDNCQKSCTRCKPGTTCRKYDGYCEENCADGKRGSSCTSDCDTKCLSCQRYNQYACTACVPNKYGYNTYYSYYQCNNPCPQNCLNSTCDDKSGDCTFGCLDGFSGHQCKCPNNCHCDNSGTCTSCKKGFDNINKNCECTKENCKTDECTSCKSSEYFVQDSHCCPCSLQVENCEKCKINERGGFSECTRCMTGLFPSSSKYCSKCSKDCTNSTCDPVTGSCTLGCKKRLWGDKCDKHCDLNCLECDQHNKSCIVCGHGRYLSECSKTCPRSCKTKDDVLKCSIQNGACIDGCRSMTHYGTYCEQSCSKNCTNQHCDWQTSYCLEGCIDNHYGDTCDYVCSPTCLPSSSKRRCYDTNGTCIDGCINGYYGDMCETQCSTNCINMTCEQFSGSCLNGCSDGYEGNDCTRALSQGGGEITPVTGGIIAAAAVVLICIIVAASIFVKRRKQNDAVRQRDPDEQEAVSYNNVARAADADDDDNCPVYALPNKLKKSEPQATSDTTTTTTTALSNPQYQVSSTSNVITSDAVYANDSVASPKKPARNKSREPSADKPRTAVSVNLDKETVSVSFLEEELLDENKPVTDENETYYNVAAVLKRRIALEKLQQFVSDKTKDDFVHEFQSLPVGLIKSYNISKSGNNASKNRYQGIYPYDDTLVVLKGENAGYMNANYIDGYRKNHAYIASMGPAIKYMKDISPFWKMIWQEKVGKIVMLTRLWEAGSNKCDQYWPDKDFSDTFDGIIVTCQSELVYAEYAVRSFQLTKKSEKRMIQQIHYTAWPDKGTPDDVTSLVEFRQKVNSLQSNLDGPILVHCSAGIGRTGTYIALDMLTLEGQTEDSVDILACVRNMREQRVNMVQTWDQYRYLHNALVHTLTFDSKAIEATSFHNYMTSHSNAVLGKKFTELQATIENRSEDETLAIKRNKDQTEKNRPGADIPGDLDRPRLYLGITRDTSDYVNAVFVDSYKHSKHYIIAQTPLPGTVTDFLTLVVQEKCSLIIAMDAENSTDNSIGVYYPTNTDIMKTGSFTVNVSSTEKHEQFVHREMSIKHQQSKKRSEQIEVTHLQFTQWDQNMHVPGSSEQFLHFVKYIETLTQTSGRNGPVLAHCTTAGSRSGLFCVVATLLEKIECNQEVSVVNTVRQIKSKRHMVIPNKEQYIFCHQCVKDYLESFDVYSNFATKT